MNELHLFAGAGGGILAGQMLGHRCVCAVEWEPYAAAVLVARQNDGLLPPFPVWDDVRTFDGRPWRGIVDVVAGGFPCQDISVAGKGAGITGERSGMWSHMARIVGEVRPRYVFVENSPALLTRGLGVVLSDLAALGYDCRWTVLGAADVGAPHSRERIWLVAYAAALGLQGHQQQQQIRQSGSTVSDLVEGAERHWVNLPEPYGLRRLDGVAAGVDRLKAIGNGQVPLCAATAWQLLTGQTGVLLDTCQTTDKTPNEIKDLGPSHVVDHHVAEVR